ncbi:TonB family protein [Pseudomonas frederiksbergensis]|uniref:TonB family protein n=1 Tax=Pseudomonas TaxID=286 RepID=UPI003D25A32B
MNQKQIALLLCSVAAVLMALSGIAIIRSESLRTEMEGKFDAQEGKLETQQRLLDKLTANQLAMLPLLDPDRGQNTTAAKLDSAQVMYDESIAPPATGTIDPANPAPASNGSGALAPDQHVPVQTVTEPRDPGPGLLQSQPLTGNAPQMPDDTILALASPVSLPPSPTPKMVVIHDGVSSVADEAPPKPAPVFQNVDEILVQKIVSKWQRPANVRDGISVRVKIWMERDGRFRNAKVTRTSGDKQFDLSAIDAIMAVKKVPEIRNVSDDTFKRLYKERTLDF